MKFIISILRLILMSLTAVSLVAAEARKDIRAIDSSLQAPFIPRPGGSTLEPDLAFEQHVTTPGEVLVNGNTIAYEATAETLVLRDDTGAPVASMFYVAYVAQRNPEDADRPVTFIYGGGPGGSSSKQHLLGFGPRRIETDNYGATHNPPFKFLPNYQTLLDKTDLVYVDAIGTGFSRPLPGIDGKQFWGVDQDIDAFARGIIRYITINHRWNSPKFLFGQSYGTTRSAGLVYVLQKKGVQMNGVILVASVLNWGIRADGFEQNSIALVSSYAAAAWYHDRLADKPESLPVFLQKVREWAAGPYATALGKGMDISADEEDSVALQLAAFTGLSVEFVKENNLRVRLDRFRKELLRDEDWTVSRFDARFKGFDADDGGDKPEFDPASVTALGSVTSTLHSYFENELKFHLNLEYLNPRSKIFIHLDWRHLAPGGTDFRKGAGDGMGLQLMPDTALDLSQAMRHNPELKVISLNGWFDLTAPFFQAEYDLLYMGLPLALRENVKFCYYPAGHTSYVYPVALAQMKSDLAPFYDDAVKLKSGD